jgi:hypothetical protein
VSRVLVTAKRVNGPPPPSAFGLVTYFMTVFSTKCRFVGSTCTNYTYLGKGHSHNGTYEHLDHDKDGAKMQSLYQGFLSSHHKSSGEMRRTTVSRVAFSALILVTTVLVVLMLSTSRSPWSSSHSVHCHNSCRIQYWLQSYGS